MREILVGVVGGRPGQREGVKPGNSEAWVDLLVANK